MHVHTASFGEIEVKEEEIFEFVQGIPGFDEYIRFVVIAPDDIAPFSYVQLMEEPDVSFLVADPFYFFKDYDFTLSSAVQDNLGIQQGEDIRIFTIVTINQQAATASANLLAPIVVNMKSKLAQQIILHDSPYKVKHELPLESEQQSVGGE